MHIRFYHSILHIIIISLMANSFILYSLTAVVVIYQSYYGYVLGTGVHPYILFILNSK